MSPPVKTNADARSSVRAPLVVTLLLFLTSLTALGSGFMLPIIQLRIEVLETIIVSWINHVAFNITRGTALACDVGIVAALCWLLETRKTEVRRVNSVLDGIMMFAIQRGVLQTIIQGGEVIAVSTGYPCHVSLFTNLS